MKKKKKLKKSIRKMTVRAEGFCCALPILTITFWPLFLLVLFLTKVSILSGGLLNNSMLLTAPQLRWSSSAKNTVSS